MAKRRPDYEPSCAEIRCACEEIQRGWSDRERRKRAGALDNPNWLPPSVELESLIFEDAGTSPMS